MTSETGMPEVEVVDYNSPEEAPLLFAQDMAELHALAKDKCIRYSLEWQPGRGGNNRWLVHVSTRKAYPKAVYDALSSPATPSLRADIRASIDALKALS
ncbi:hypothetical protein D3C85_270620 [compost metagenome]